MLSGEGIVKEQGKKQAAVLVVQSGGDGGLSRGSDGEGFKKYFYLPEEDC